jgi:hypothetical protein
LAPFLLSNGKLSLINYCKIAKNKFIKMKKILFIALFAIIAISCDKKDEHNTNSIVGRWMVSQVVFTETEIGTGTDLIDDTTYNINDTETYAVPGDSLDGFGVEFLTDGSVITFDNSDSETYTYSYSNSTLTIYGDIFDEDTSVIDVSNLTSNSMNWNWTYTEREIESDSSQGFISDITYTETIAFSFTK